MTKQQAQEALHQGHKITHMYFSRKEYIHLVNGSEYFEDGYQVPSGWWNKEWAAEDWEIFKES